MSPTISKLVILLFVFVSAVLTAKFANAADFKLNSEVNNTKEVAFIKHQGAGQWDNYLAMNIPFAPIAELYHELKSAEKTALINRGEAHITVITPIEFWNVLRSAGVTINEINQLAGDLKIQESQFEVMCLGRGEALVDGKAEQTFYVVVDTPALVKIRQNIQSLYILKGGKPESFNPTNYFPHITLGFSKRDLHESDGVFKNIKSCIDTIKLY